MSDMQMRGLVGGLYQTEPRLSRAYDLVCAEMEAAINGDDSARCERIGPLMLQLESFLSRAVQDVYAALGTPPEWKVGFSPPSAGTIPELEEIPLDWNG